MVNRLKAGLLLVVVFVAGAAAGWGAERWTELRWTPRAGAARQSSSG